MCNKYLRRSDDYTVSRQYLSYPWFAKFLYTGWSSEPREGPAIFLRCGAKKVPSVLKALSIGPAPEITPTDQAYQRLQKKCHDC